MKLKKGIIMLLVMCICCMSCGCAYIDNTDDMVSPPELTGEMSPIADALYAVAGKDCDLKYPSTGSHRSAIILEDINGDSIFEAFAFYSTSGDEMTTMHINVICQSGGKWVSVSDQTIVATGVETFLGVDPYTKGSSEVVGILQGEIENWVGAKFVVETDLDKMCDLMCEHIEKKRAALGI